VNRPSVQLLFFTAAGAVLGGCSNTKFLDAGQALLTKHTVEFTKPDTVSDSRSISSGLLRLTYQKPNEKALGLFRARLWLYNRTRNAKGGVFKSLHDKGGEAPVIIDSTTAAASAQSMTDYLFDKGYFNGRVSYSVHLDSARGRPKKKGSITYHVTRGPLTRIDSVKYEIADQRMNEFKDVTIAKSPLKAGQPYDVDYMRSERNRIASFMQNWGYRDFGSQYIFFEADTIGPGNTATIYVRILPPEGDSVHRVFYVDRVFVYADCTDTTQGLDTTLHDGIYVLSKGPGYKPHALTNPIRPRPGELYSKEKQLRTARKFSELDAFAFVNIKYANDRDTFGRHRACDMIVQLKSSSRRTLSAEATANSSSDQFKGIGSEVKVTFRNRNLLQVADLFELNASGGMEVGIDSGKLVLNTVDVNGDASLTFPSQLLTKIKISTRLTLLKRLGLYDFRSVAVSANFDHLERPFNRWIGGLQLMFSGVANTEPAFDLILAERPTLRRSFETINIFGPNLTFAYNSQARENRKTPHILYTRLSADVGIPVPIGAFSRFVKLDAEVKRLWRMGKRASLVGRATSGMAVPLWGDVVPYVKQFVIGGPNSIRAWRVRSLGPGVHDTTGGAAYFEDQSGDIKIELNLEYRFDLIGAWGLEAALFVDAGNIWLIKANDEVPDGEFTSAFINQFAIGTGGGLRIDLSFVIVRLDIGTKVRYPNGEWFPDGIHLLNGTWRSEQLNFNLGIGYPF
jgi:outer membrane protein assembly factor BamA